MVQGSIIATSYERLYEHAEHEEGRKEEMKETSQQMPTPCTRSFWSNQRKVEGSGGVSMLPGSGGATR